MADNYLWASGYRLAQIRVMIEGMIVLYDIDVRPLTAMGMERGLHGAVGAVDAIGIALIELREIVRELQGAQLQAVISEDRHETAV